MTTQFTTQVFRKSNPAEPFFELSRGESPLDTIYHGQGFLNSFFFKKYLNSTLYYYLFRSTSENAKIIVSTVCEFDKDRPYSSTDDWNIYRFENLDEYEIQAFKQFYKKNIERMGASLKEAFSKGYYIVCDETKQYLNTRHLLRINDSFPNYDINDPYTTALVCPIALLTRVEKQSRGQEDIECDTTNPLEVASYNLWGTWFGKEIYATRTKPSEDYTNISYDMQVFRYPN